jgi:hypothetical protein
MAATNQCDNQSCLPAVQLNQINCTDTTTSKLMQPPLIKRQKCFTQPDITGFVTASALMKLQEGLSQVSKRDVAMLKLPTYKRTREHEVLWAIEDLIGPCSSWPDRERQIYWMKKLNHRDALRVVTFGLGNGLPPHLIFEWLRVREVKVHWPDFHNDMQLIQKIMELEEPIDKFYYDLRAKEWCFMNGLPRNAITKKVKGRKTEQGTKASLPSP